MFRQILQWRLLLAFIPIALGLDWYRTSASTVFIAAALAIIPLAKLMGDATEAIAEEIGPIWGGLLNASFGNAPEAIVSIFALSKGLFSVVKASITGAIIGDLLLGLGLSMVVGGMKHGVQSINVKTSRVSAGLLTASGFGLIIPTVFNIASPGATRIISLQIAPLLLTIYIASIVYTLANNEPVVGKCLADATPNDQEWNNHSQPNGLRYQALAVLAMATLGLAVMSEILTRAIEPASEGLNITPAFAGVFLLALLGNVPDYLNAIRFGLADKSDLALATTVGSSVQVALLVAPVLVFVGVLLGQDIDLVFSQAEVVAITLSVYVTRNVIYDGEANWFRGLMLIVIYSMLGVGFFNLPAHTQ
ncbi:calcium/proton exchanger [Schlesneria paludicola]|uniref:calcium/proton exchanger n=1 Tax=Schlesneria paludicola TaxID=360056 RepID=UPI00029B1785|nr:calcium/proton exchanger [Schlesneria paludicola]